MPTRLSRTEQVERNRGLVLDAARAVFVAHGYAGASLEAIAAEAGFSKGVVYSQFAGKPDMFLALLERRIAERAVENTRLARDGAGLPGLQQLLRVNDRRTAEDEGWAQLLIEFRVVAARDPELGRRYRALHEGTRNRLAEAIVAVLARGGLAPALPATRFAEMVLALDTGVTLERAADPGSLPVEVLQHLVTWLVEPLAEELT